MAQPPIGPGSRTQPVVQDLRVSGQLMTLEPGLYCVIQTPSPGADIRAGMPGVRISPAPGMAARPDGVTILGFRPDGFLSIGQGPQMGPYVLPGTNSHTYDIPLFWANVRADVTRRVEAWHQQSPTSKHRGRWPWHR